MAPYFLLPSMAQLIRSDVPDKARRGPRALAALVKTEIARWTPIIKAANVKAE